MTMEECYQEIGGDFAEVSVRLPSPGLIEKFAGKFLEGKSFEMLCRAMNAGNREEAFRAAHTLKGVCANLSFRQLLNSVGQLTEELRPETETIPDTAASLMEEVQRDYQVTAAAIRRYRGEA